MIKKKDIEEAKIILKEMIEAIPIFHDLGKINPNFQIEKMGNKEIIRDENFIETKHSFISAIIYLSYFRNKIVNKVKGRKIKDLLKEFILYHAYIIERHHSDIDKIGKFVGKINFKANPNTEQAIKELPISKLIEAITKSKIYMKDLSLKKGSTDNLIASFEDKKFINKNDKRRSEKQGIYICIYIRWLYSLLVASDYYATSEFMNGGSFNEVDDLNNIQDWINVYENTDLMKNIRKYQNENYPMSMENLNKATNINILRSEIFCEAEEQIKNNYQENIFYLEAPTGSGKSNTAMNLSFKLMSLNKDLCKVFWIYPFNTLVEQNLDTLENIFGKKENIISRIAVINSLTPIKLKHVDCKGNIISENDEPDENNEKNVYRQSLLDRQFLNYPMILSTHVSLFNTIFGESQQNLFGFYQLINSVIVLDEIQSYKNSIWTEIIYFLKQLSNLFNMKIIIMSATLPNLDRLSQGQSEAIFLLKNSNKFFKTDCFKNRVQLNYDLLDTKVDDKFNQLKEHLKQHLDTDKKILIEFIKKRTANDFWLYLVEDEYFREKSIKIEYLSGDDSLAERKRILDKIKQIEDTIVLVATQVIEAGVDIDMDIGYKNISKLDSEEQFIGRINRSCKRKGITYFFKIDNAKDIYKNDIRVDSKFTLEKENMREILINKNFGDYYNKILDVTKNNNKAYIKDFLGSIADLNYEYIDKHMKLIDEDKNIVQVYLARKIVDINGDLIDGKEIWKQYVNLWKMKCSMDYAEWKVKMSIITSKMNYFIYQVNKSNLELKEYNDKMGNIIYIEDGDKYFTKDKFNREMLQGVGGIDFI
ncbi:CRISPR-associated helicase Cas3' [Megamonas funiformis]|uniref:CRISPR-associated helicase Cas3' n=1 Tax=Megamonas funiformis TaxID=437897 RepID=UPI0022E91D36|nr:CRISPR-associated helicase Cas3' [Megamonas funiformis]